MTTPQFIAIGRSTRALLEATGPFRQRCISIDFFADRDTCHGIKKAIRIGDYSEAAGHCASAGDHRLQSGVMWAGGVENNVELAETLEQVPSISILGCRSSSIREARDPRLVATALEHAGLPALEIREPGPTHGGSLWIVKPLRSGGGERVQMIDDCNAAIDARHFYLQRFVAGDVYGATFIGREKNAQLIGCCRHLPSTTARAPFRYEGSVGPSPMPESIDGQIRKIGECVASRFGLVGWFGIDVTVDREKVWLLEVNPRFTASMELLDSRTGTSLFLQHLSAFDFNPFDGWPDSVVTDTPMDQKPVAAKRVLFNDTNRDLVIDSRISDALWEFNLGSESPVCDVPHPDWTATPGSPICSIRTQGDDEPEVMAQLSQIKKTVTSILK